MMVLSTLLLPIKTIASLILGQSCNPTGGGFLGLPPWYAYLNGVASYAPGSNASDPHPVLVCAPAFSGLSDIWLVVAAIVEILLRLSALVAIIFVIVGAVEFITSQGEPAATAKARNTLISALVGVVIAVIAAAVVAFIAGQFKAS